jgi:hypothetical protein
LVANIFAFFTFESEEVVAFTLMSIFFLKNQIYEQNLVT